MKKYVFILMTTSLIMAMMVSCNKEDFLEKENGLEVQSSDEAAFKVQPPFVDLSISLYTTDIASTSKACATGIDLPDVHCNTGDRIFASLVIIQNNGNAVIPTGFIEVRWDDLLTGTSSVTQVSHGNIPPGGSIYGVQGFDLGPCGCNVNENDPDNCYIHSFSATVDPNNLITESNESNNDSMVYDTCDGCGNCPIPG